MSSKVKGIDANWMSTYDLIWMITDHYVTIWSSFWDIAYQKNQWPCIVLSRSSKVKGLDAKLKTRHDFLSIVIDNFFGFQSDKLKLQNHAHVELQAKAHITFVRLLIMLGRHKMLHKYQVNEIRWVVVNLWFINFTLHEKRYFIIHFNHGVRCEKQYRANLLVFNLFSTVQKYTRSKKYCQSHTIWQAQPYHIGTRCI